MMKRFHEYIPGTPENDAGAYGSGSSHSGNPRSGGTDPEDDWNVHAAHRSSPPRPPHSSSSSSSPRHVARIKKSFIDRGGLDAFVPGIGKRRMNLNVDDFDGLDDLDALVQLYPGQFGDASDDEDFEPRDPMMRFTGHRRQQSFRDVSESEIDSDVDSMIDGSDDGSMVGSSGTDGSSSNNGSGYAESESDSDESHYLPGVAAGCSKKRKKTRKIELLKDKILLPTAGLKSAPDGDDSSDSDFDIEDCPVVDEEEEESVIDGVDVGDTEGPGKSFEHPEHTSPRKYDPWRDRVRDPKLREFRVGDGVEEYDEGGEEVFIGEGEEEGEGESEGSFDYGGGGGGGGGVWGGGGWGGVATRRRRRWWGRRGPRHRRRRGRRGRGRRTLETVPVVRRARRRRRRMTTLGSLLIRARRGRGRGRRISLRDRRRRLGDLGSWWRGGSSGVGKGREGTGGGGGGQKKTTTTKGCIIY